MKPDSVFIPKDSLQKLLQTYQAFQNGTQDRSWTEIFLIGIVIVLSGTFGGVVNYYYRPEDKASQDTEHRSMVRSVLLGIAASILIPLFLEITQSKILDGVLLKNSNLFLLIAFCVLAGIFSTRFISTISNSVLKEVDQLKKQVQEVEKKSDTANQKADVSLQVIEQRNSTILTPLTLSARPSAPTDDPRKGQYGGSAIADGFELSVQPGRVPFLNHWYNLTFLVQSIDPSKTLTGNVTFYLHPTFTPDEITVTAENGIAKISKIAWGAFTLGAEILDTGTTLELDLSNDTRFSEEFRKQ